MNSVIWSALGYLECLWAVTVLTVSVTIVNVLMGGITIKSMDDNDGSKNESQRKSDEIKKRIVRATRVSVLALVMFTVYVLSVGSNAANKEVILSQNACTRDKIDKDLSLKESEYIRNYEVVNLARECQKEENRKEEEKNKREEEEKEKREKEEKEKTRMSQLEWLRSEKRKE